MVEIKYKEYARSVDVIRTIIRNRVHHLEVTAAGLRRTKMTESPLRKSLAMYLSLLTGLALLFPFPVFGTSVHISFTFSSTMLK